MDATYLNRGEDFEQWQVAEPTYQVEFWTHLADRLPNTPPELVGYKKDAYLVRGAADVEEAIGWARENAKGRIAVVYAVIPDTSHGRGLFHLLGSDPTRSD